MWDADGTFLSVCTEEDRPHRIERWTERFASKPIFPAKGLFGALSAEDAWESPVAEAILVGGDLIAFHARSGLFGAKPPTLDRCDPQGDLRWSVRAEMRGELIAGAGGRFWIRNLQRLYGVDAAGNVGSAPLPDDFTLPDLDGDPAPIASLPCGDLLLFEPLHEIDTGDETSDLPVGEAKGSVIRLRTEQGRIVSATRVP